MVALAPRRLGPDDADDLAAAHAIIVACGKALAAGGWPNWDPAPITLERMRAVAGERDVYLVRDGVDAVATFTVGTTPPHRYPSAVFAPERSALYLNRLAVVPARWRTGLGRACMVDVEARARAAAVAAVRFDAFRDNAPLREFYRRLGYIERGPFQVGPIPVVCFEKVLP
jgi:GNAT superfamily N-acetyltransferase